MEYINIVFEGDLNDVDVVAVPKELIPKIDEICQEFLQWVPCAPEDDLLFWCTVNGVKYSAAETDGFIKWLNETYCSGSQKAYLVNKHIQWTSKYESIHF